jgi:flagellar basal body P-ring protein FlgI
MLKFCRSIVMLVMSVVISMASSGCASKARGAGAHEQPSRASDTLSVVGFGVVSGLPGTGDGDSPHLRKVLSIVLPGRTFSARDLKTFAIVSVTARLVPPIGSGDSFAARVAAIDPETRLQGGTLVPTQLTAERDSSWLALAEGPVEVDPSNSHAGTLIVKATAHFPIPSLRRQ